jgi:subtilase family serine protease
MLPGHVPGAVTNFHLPPVGRLPETNRLDLVIGLPLRNQDAFSNRMTQLYNSTSPQFHHWLTPDQIARQFGPATGDYQGLIAWAQTNGLAVITMHSNHLLLRVRGTVTDIERMFHVTLRVYQHPVEPRTFYAPDVEPSVDLSVPLLHITGLSDYSIPHPPKLRRVPAPKSLPPDAVLEYGTGPTNSYWGNDFRTTYLPGATQTGSKQVLGIVAQDDYYDNDIASYISQSGISTGVTVARVPVDGGVASPSSDNDEVSLDIEMAMAMAPGLSEILVYEAPSNHTDYVDILAKMQEDNAAAQLSSSLVIQAENPGLDSTEDMYYQLFAMQGQSFFQASGDNGPYLSADQQWADSPYVTIVGGTQVYTTNHDGQYFLESAWQNSGGGYSTNYLGNYTIPAWQQGVSMSLNGGSTTMRNVPDVAFIAADIYLVSNNGSNSIAAGTSAATPLWAGFTALVNEQAAANHQPTVGFLNPALYAIGLGPNYNNCFHDITSGHSLGIQNNQPVNIPAVTGYDLCTGWGTPNGTNLIFALVPYSDAVWVDFNYMGPQNGSYDLPFETLTSGVSSVRTNGNIWIRTAGTSHETLQINKPITIRAANGPAKVGN